MRKLKRLASHIKGRLTGSDAWTSDRGSNLSDEPEAESFEALKPKIVHLCDVLCLGMPRELEEIHFGKNYRIISIKFDESNDYPDCVIRFPQPFAAADEEESAVFRNQIALYSFLDRRVPVPHVVSYDLTVENVLSIEYILQTRLPGVPLQDMYRTFSLEQKLRIVDQVVSFIVSCESMCFDTAGTFICAAATQIPRRYAWADLIKTQLGVVGFGAASGDSRLEWQGLLDILDAMGRRAGPQGNVMHHYEFHPRNITVEFVDDRWNISGVLDWDKALSLPRWMARKPPFWLWGSLMEDYVDDDEEELGLPESRRFLAGDQKTVKEYFDAEIEKKLPGYTKDAYGREGRWYRRVVAYALLGIERTGDYEVMRRFVNRWQKPNEWQDANPYDDGGSVYETPLVCPVRPSVQVGKPVNVD